MQPNHCDLLGQVREPGAASQLMRDGHSRDPGQPRSSGAAGMRSEASGMLIPFYTQTEYLSPGDSASTCRCFVCPHFALQYVLTAILHRLLDRSIIAAVVFVLVLGCYK
jgi:hypothetical protein